MRITDRAFVLAILVLAAVAWPAAVAATPPGDPVPSAEHGQAAAGPLAGVSDALRSWLAGFWSTPEPPGVHTVTGSSGHHMDPNGSAESADSETRRPVEPHDRVPGAGPEPGVP